MISSVSIGATGTGESILDADNEATTSQDGGSSSAGLYDACFELISGPTDARRLTFGRQFDKLSLVSLIV